ncbi:MAG: 3-dehydroquinate dehydratase [Halobacteriovoraceae bacterium]|nr:3-dehydroquinate dehydratase [Halobacteriovoraceae bacterium]
MKICIINGPNLNILGKREVEIYGKETLEEIMNYTVKKAASNNLGQEIDWMQSNSEAEIINKIHELEDQGYDGLVINPAGLSHTSVCLLDALRSLQIPIAEVHLTNVYKRESYRHRMLTAQAADFIMKGLGKEVYYIALYSLREYHQSENANS